MAVEVAALFIVPDVIGEVEREATLWVQHRLADYAVDIKNTTGATRDASGESRSRPLGLRPSPSICVRT